MKFTNWLLINENIASNFDSWLMSVVKHANIHDLNTMGLAEFFGYDWNSLYGSQHSIEQLQEKILKRFNGTPENSYGGIFKKQKDIIIRVLSRKNLENINWLSFSLGYLTKKFFQEEDLDLAIEVTKNRINRRDLLKSDIGRLGWFQIGREVDKFVKEHILQQQEISNRQKKRLQKQGDILEKDEELIRFVAKEDNYELILLPKLNIHPDFIEEKKEKVESRKRLLCKYGKGTEWCTANPTGTYDSYYLNNDIYIVNENNKPKYQFVGCNSAGGRAGSSGLQFMDIHDESVKEITYKEKKFLNKYAKKEIGCYDFSLIFESISEFENSDNADRGKISSHSCSLLIQDENFKNLKEYYKKNIIKQAGSYIWEKQTAEKLSEEEYELVGNKQIVVATKMSLNSPWIHTILNKIPSKKFEDLVNDETSPSVIKQGLSINGDLTKIQVRKNNIRKLLNYQDKHGEESLYNLFKIIKLLVSKISIGPPEAYTIFDFAINQIHSIGGIRNFEDGNISVHTKKILSKLAESMGKDAIEKIDLNRMQERLSIKFIKVGDKYKIESRPYKFMNSLIVYFLKKYSNAILDD